MGRYTPEQRKILFELITGIQRKIRVNFGMDDKYSDLMGQVFSRFVSSGNGTNATRLADVTAIPEATVRNRVEKLLEHGSLQRGPNGLLYPTAWLMETTDLKDENIDELIEAVEKIRELGNKSREEELNSLLLDVGQDGTAYIRRANK